MKKNLPSPQMQNALIIMVQLSSLGACYFLLPQTGSFWQIALLALAFAVVMNSVYSIIHEAHHAVLFRNRQLNDCAGAFMSLFFPAAFHLLRQGHLGHHVRNRSDDEVFDLYFDKRDRVWKTIVWYGILTGAYWMLVVASNIALLFLPGLLSAKKYSWHRTFEAFLESFNPAYMRLMRIEALGALTVHALIVISLSIPLWKYFVMYYAFGLSWSSMQYVHHYAAERDVLKGARNLYLWGLLDKIWLYHNWHRTHHSNPRVPWCYLPDLARQQGDDLSFLPKLYFKMWRGPQFTNEHVINRYAGRILG